jgi:hypothetical protein
LGSSLLLFRPKASEDVKTNRLQQVLDYALDGISYDTIEFADQLSPLNGRKILFAIEIIVPYMIRLRFRDFVKECKNLLIYRLSHTEGCAKVLFFCPLFSTDYFERVQLSVHDGNFAHPYNDEAVP